MTGKMKAVSRVVLRRLAGTGSGRRRGMTLLELLVVIAIISLLLLLLIPAVKIGMESGRKARCLNNLRVISSAAVCLYQDEWPHVPYRGEHCTDWGAAANALAPYIGGNLEVFSCPSKPSEEIPAGPFGTELPDHPGVYTGYEFNGYLSRCDAESESQKRRQPMIMSYAQCALAYDYPYLPDAPDRPHKGGINVAYLDGHAVWLPDERMGENVTSWPFSDDAFFLQGHPWR